MAQSRIADLPLATRQQGGTSIIILPELPQSSAFPAPTVSAASRVVVVQWKDVEARTGYIVDVDKKGLLVAVVHVGDKRYPKDYSDSRVLVTQTGVTWTRARRVGYLAEHNELPQKWQWLMKVWKTALTRDVELELNNMSPESRPECALCKKTVLESGERDGSDPCVTCPLCLLPAHKECGQEILRHLLWQQGGDQAEPAFRSSSSSSSAGAGLLSTGTRNLPVSANSLNLPEELRRCLVSYLALRLRLSRCFYRLNRYDLSIKGHICSFVSDLSAFYVCVITYCSVSSVPHCLGSIFLVPVQHSDCCFPMPQTHTQCANLLWLLWSFVNTRA